MGGIFVGAVGLGLQRRNPIVNDPRIRGSRIGRLPASGSYWVPARMDLDTMLSKIDSRLIGDVLTIHGPYAVRYGPGFSFVDFALTGQYRINECWSAVMAAGYAERPPSLTEMYTAETFMYVLQNGLNIVTGDPRLRHERLLQADLGLRYDDEMLRARVGGFYGWAWNYITFENMGFTRGPPVGEIQQIEYKFVNEAASASRWSIELSARVVEAQRRVASSLLELPSSGFAVGDVRGYWRVSERLLTTAGIENFTNANYREHLNFTSQDRLIQVFQPGLNAYVGAELSY